MNTYFKFNNNSSLDILPDTELLICSMENEYSATTPILSREIIKTDFSQQQDVQRITGSKYSEGFIFNFVLIKNPCQIDNNEFTFDEINSISNWLYGTGASQKFEIFCDELPELPNSSYYYIGMFSSIERIRYNGTVGLKCVFETDSQYIYVNRKASVNFTGTRISEKINVSCQEFVYPKINLSISNVEDDAAIYISSDQIMDNGNYYHSKTQLWLNSNSPNRINIDGDNAIITDGSDTRDFSILGWDDVNKIQWLRFKNGENELTFGGANLSCEITITWQDKILGGVLNEFSV